ncbi:FAD-binding oxidoreductase [Neomicrococcus aestuarii]|uniref:FAD-binding oxidoreductase n=1 Tax=Neomicrococcus aestuarii TaxID=556325 RepID=A0A1L2ZRG2_9MICC|nr:FAD-binding oxidoreductase [Neomicrococcus aestuarii]
MNDFESIVAELTETLASTGAASVLRDSEALIKYQRDMGALEDPHLPLAVVLAESVSDVQNTLRWASKHRISVVPRGAGTGVSGAAHAIECCMVLSLELMNRIIEVRPDDEIAVVEPGVVNADLNAAVAQYGLMYAPDPASYQQSTIGGNVSTNAGGLRCAKYGVTRDSVLGLTVVMADGTIIETGKQTFKGVAGYDLTSLVIGSEGTLGIVVSATVRLRYLSKNQRAIAAIFPDIETAAQGVLEIGRARIQPAILELLDDGVMAVIDSIHGTQLQGTGGALLLALTDGFGALLEEQAIRDQLSKLGATLFEPDDPQAMKLLEMRRVSRGDEQDDVYRVGEDVAVPRSKLVDYVHELRLIAERHKVWVRTVAHAGDGNLHPTFWIDPAEGEAGLTRLERALDDSIRSALAIGGTITGEHGVGQYKLRWLGWEQSEQVRELQYKIKEVFDPQGILNPGKAI